MPNISQSLLYYLGDSQADVTIGSSNFKSQFKNSSPFGREFLNWLKSIENIGH